jgi:hypothetical protein
MVNVFRKALSESSPWEVIMGGNTPCGTATPVPRRNVVFRDFVRLTALVAIRIAHSTCWRQWDNARKTDVRLEGTGREGTSPVKESSSMNPNTPPRKAQGGYVLVAISAIVLMILATGIAFMRWSTDEDLQSMETSASMQAYYLAQMGVVEQGFTWLRTQPAAQLPVGQVFLPGRTVSAPTPYSYSYRDIVIDYISGSSGNVWAVKHQYGISCVGVVHMPVSANPGEQHFKDVTRKAVLYVEIRNFVDYMYLTGEEQTNFGDYIKFMHGDTLWGRVHSNSQIAIMQDPVFYNLVSSTAEDFWRGSGYNPHFYGPRPVFRAPRVQVPDSADNLRRCAAQGGSFYSYTGYTLRAIIGPGPNVTIYKWPTGTDFDPRDHWSLPISSTDGTCMFVRGPLEIAGDTTGGPFGHGFSGRLTIGSSENLRILDNIHYEDAIMPYGTMPIGTHSTNVLGIVSEGDVKIANTPANGRGNSGVAPPASGSFVTNSRRNSITLTAAIVALGESFTFENQNDPDSGYVFNNGNGPDDRGTIYLYGSVTQARRGYVHRSCLGSTGYLKQYKYDNRLLTNRPPGFFDVTDNSGRALFDVVQWGQGYPNPADPVQTTDKIVRFN